MMGGLAIKSLVDVGCGKGVSTKYFYDHGIKVLCVEVTKES
jgi:16S rRNA A1518/A1519 N6-dimethyltransferase RsmA/KsgA/DIM1 with predicted DNA glycosylase/AP lyase activity